MCFPTAVVHNPTKYHKCCLTTLCNPNSGQTNVPMAAMDSGNHITLLAKVIVIMVLCQIFIQYACLPTEDVTTRVHCRCQH